MIAMALPTILLYEGAILAVDRVEKARLAREAADQAAAREIGHTQRPLVREAGKRGAQARHPTNACLSGAVCRCAPNGSLCSVPRRYGVDGWEMSEMVGRIQSALFIDHENVGGLCPPEKIANWIAWLEDGEFDEGRKRKLADMRVYWNPSALKHEKAFEAAASSRCCARSSGG